MAKEEIVKNIIGTRGLLKTDATHLEKTLTKEHKYGEKWRLPLI